jgi:predicted extracellular nuclease
LRSGDTVANLSGILSYGFSQYRLLPTATPNFEHTNPRPSVPTEVAGTNLKVASFNVLNFFNGNGVGGGFPTARGADTAIEFSRQKAKIVNAIVGLNADVVGLTEIENDGYDTYSAIAELTASINTATNSNQWSYVNPGVSQLGTDQISLGFIYRRNRAIALGNAAILDSSIEPLFIDTKNRPTLAQTFQATLGRGVITVAINHLKSKGSDCNDLGDPDTGDGQGNCAITRTQAAQALVNWLSRNPTGVNDKDYLIIGDLNANSKETPVTTFVNAGFTDLTPAFNGPESYSYVFDGQAGSLDHGLSSSSLTQQALNAIDWHINADEPISLDYNTEFKSANQINIFYSNNAYRSSDHDPLLISLKLIIDLDGDGDVDSDDIKIVVAARNTKPTTFDQRDVNGDGVIDVNDARALTLQCTRTSCATK